MQECLGQNLFTRGCVEFLCESDAFTVLPGHRSQRLAEEQVIHPQRYASWADFDH